VQCAGVGLSPHTFATQSVGYMGVSILSTRCTPACANRAQAYVGEVAPRQRLTRTIIVSRPLHLQLNASWNFVQQGQTTPINQHWIIDATLVMELRQQRVGGLCSDFTC